MVDVHDCPHCTCPRRSNTCLRVTVDARNSTDDVIVRRTMSKAKSLADLFQRPSLDFLMGAHDALSAQIAQDCGFPGVWVSGLGLSASSGLRDSNELSWTQVMERTELVADRVSVPALVDLDTGYGDFNNVRLVMRRLQRADVGGGCIEDKLFPKTNSFIGAGQQLADPHEFGGRIKAAKDTVGDEVFLVARCEALVAGRSMTEATDRCGGYAEAGADAILIHSKMTSPDEIVSFMASWDGRVPVVIVPTKYSKVPADVFERAGISVAIWANQTLRAAIRSMEKLCVALREQRTMLHLEGEIADLSRVFDLTNNAELELAKELYASHPAGSSLKALADDGGPAGNHLVGAGPTSA
ncbi:isocitrate lyase/phosphoenolpyruvate mutase family protein [Micromonospora profundi]|uniref:Isocitrate lyase/phosphoenolpyruvate mutase family protein n=2 Tax=Micromonospora profundi TaxID=1420889 RepID=A0AAJ6L467_9ACTN|nr:isocitrate lyase/phosphoenolpyruvate mutase family protein [Micromonospora profundi]WLS47156.1 isocitrate lyase/phosphoenolpyruvate mutase family protein [Micromonospora profundi]